MASAKSASKKNGKQRNRFFNKYNVAGLFLCLLLLPGFIICTSLLVSTLFHRDAPPSCFGYTPLMVKSGSMAPVFDENDLLIIKNTGDDAPTTWGISSASTAGTSM